MASKLGIAESTVRNWDIGRHSPRLPIEEIPKFLEVYGCTLQEAIEAAKNSRKKFDALDGEDKEGQHTLTAGGAR